MFDARLRTLLGSAVKDASYGRFLTLIKNEQAVEGPDLDYKGDLYDKGTEGAGELAKDVAALANAGGGTLILGLHENKTTSVPQVANPLPLTDRLRKDYRETLALRLDPPVQCDIDFIAKDPDAAKPQGLIVISVPPSAHAPHAVVGTKDLRDGTLRFPLRNDNTTTFMNLSQIKRALALSARLSAGRRDTLDQAEEQVFAQWVQRGGERPALTVTVVPDLPGAFPIDNASFETFKQQTAENPTIFGNRSSLHRFGVGPRRFIAADSDARPRRLAHFHADGSTAWTIEGPTASAFPPEVYVERLRKSWDTDRLVTAVLEIAQQSARHAVDQAGASSTATLRVRLNGDGPCPLATDRDLTTFRVFSPAEPEIAVGETSFLLEAAAEGGTELVRAAAGALADLFQNFGVVETEQLTLDGKINLSGWSHRARQAMRTWAEEAGLETLPTA